MWLLTLCAVLIACVIYSIYCWLRAAGLIETDADIEAAVHATVDDAFRGS